MSNRNTGREQDTAGSEIQSSSVYPSQGRASKVSDEFSGTENNDGEAITFIYLLILIAIPYIHAMTEMLRSIQ